MPTVAGGARTNTRRMKTLRAEFFAEGKRLDAAGDPAADCWLCKQRIDYDVDPGTTAASHNLDHYFTVVEHPELQEDPTNFRHSHKECNGERGDRSPLLGLGDAVPDWW
jgi:hypothetical protein